MSFPGISSHFRKRLRSVALACISSPSAFRVTQTQHCGTQQMLVITTTAQMKLLKMRVFFLSLSIIATETHISLCKRRGFHNVSFTAIIRFLCVCSFFFCSVLSILYQTSRLYMHLCSDEAGGEFLSFFFSYRIYTIRRSSVQLVLKSVAGCRFHLPARAVTR